MAGDRVVKVSLTAQVSNYVSGMEQARKSTVAAGTSAEDAKAKFAAQNQAMTQIGTGLLAIGALAAVGVGLAVKKFADFDQAMSEVQAATHETTANMGLLRDAALEAGAKTVFTASEAANAINELAKAGVSTADVLGGGLAGSLDLASAGGLGVADAASIAATALTEFKLKGADIPHVADLLAAGAGKAQGSVDDLGQALKQGGLVASQAGMSIEETTGALAAFASAGLIGSDAGTSLKTMLIALEKPSAQASALMEQYGIDVYDSQGKMLGFSGIAGQLKDKLGGLTDAQRNSTLATIFGTDAVRSAAVLYDQGAKGIEDWNAKVNDSGFAAETARIKLDNLKGDLEQLGGSIDTALIQSGSAANDTLRMLVETATGLVNSIGALPAPVLAVGLGLGVVTAATLLLGGGMLTLIPKIAATKLAMHDMNITAGGLAKGIGKGGLLMAALTVATVAVSGLGTVGELSAVDLAKLGAELDRLGSKGSMDSLFTGMNGTALATNGLAEAANKLTDSGLDGFMYQYQKGVYGATNAVLGWIPAIKDLDNGITKNEAQFKSLGTSLASLAATDIPGASKKFNEMVAALGGGDKATQQLLDLMPDYKAALIAQAAAAGKVVTGTDEAANKTNLLEYAQKVAAPTALTAADAYLAAADKASGLDDQLRKLIDTLNEANGLGQDAVSANATYQKSLAGISAEIQAQRDEYEKANGTLDGFTASLDESTVVGSANAEMLSGLAGDAQAAAEAQYQLDLKTMSAKDATDKYVATLVTSKEAIIAQATANGLGADAVQALTDKVYAVPDQHTTDMMIETAAADGMIDAFVARWQGKTITMSMFLDTSGGDRGLAAEAARYTGQALNYYGRASGGILPGAPSSKDNMFIHAASGEFVTNARSTADPANRRALEFMNNGGTIRGYANGGMVRPEYVSSGYSGGNYSTTTGSTFDTRFVINQVSDPIGTANAVARRLAALGA